MSIALSILLSVVALSAALLQRITGMGFALVSVPFFVIAYGPVNGVLLAIILGCAGSMLILVSLWRSISWKAVYPILLSAIVWVPIGAWVTGALSETVLLILVGSAGIVSLVGMRAPHIEWVLRQPIGPYLAGSLSSVMHVSSGLSGPPLVALAYSRRMTHLAFVASVQVVFVVFHLLTLSLRGMPTVPAAEIILYVSIGLVGTFAGVLLARKIPVTFARRLTIVIAFIGTASVLVKGLSQAIGNAGLFW